MPIMSYFIGDVYSDIGNTSESRDSPKAIDQMLERVEDTMDYNG